MTARVRTVVAALGAASALSLFGDMMLYTVLPSHHVSLGISALALGVLLSVHRFIRILANPLIGVLYDRVGRRPLFLLGMALAVLATGSYMVSTEVWWLVGGRLVWGVAFGLVSVGALSILLDVTTPADRGGSVGSYNACLHVGTMGALLLSGVLADLAGYRWTLAVLTPLTAIGAAIAYRWVPETRSAAPPTAHAGAAALGPRTLVAAYRGLDRRLLVPASLVFVAFFAGNGVLMSTIGLHVGRETSALPPATLTGVLLGLRKLCAMVAGPLAGALSDRARDRRPVTAVGAATALAGFVVLGLGHGLAAIVLGVVLAAVGEGVVLPPVAAWAGDLAPMERRGAVMAGLVTATDIGAAVGPVAAYALSGSLGLRGVYAMCAVIFAAALVLLAVTRPVRRTVSPGEPLDEPVTP